MLEEDEEIRRDGTGSEEVFQDVALQLREAGISFSTHFPTTAKRPSFGLSDREMLKAREDNDGVLPAAKEPSPGETSPSSGNNWRSCWPYFGSIWTQAARLIGNSE
jgi:hypothetical protein